MEFFLSCSLETRWFANRIRRYYGGMALCSSSAPSACSTLDLDAAVQSGYECLQKARFCSLSGKPAQCLAAIMAKRQSLHLSWFQLGQHWSFLRSIWYDAVFWLQEKNNDVNNTSTEERGAVGVLGSALLGVGPHSMRCPLGPPDFYAVVLWTLLVRGTAPAQLQGCTLPWSDFTRPH